MKGGTKAMQVLQHHGQDLIDDRRWHERRTNVYRTADRRRSMMKKLAWGLLLVAMMTPASGRAESSALDGTWSGGWISKKGYDACTVRFESDGDRVTAHMLSPQKLDFTTVTFDRKTQRVVATAQIPEQGKIEIDARIEDKTRLNGTLTRDDMSGEMRLTKWTFRP
jgi:hypothetical protein